MKNGIGKYNKHYYTGNHLSSTQLVTDASGVAAQQVEYAPFGEVVNEYNIDWNSGQVPDFKFNGKELDEENGMYYFEARYQRPPVFISRDVMFEKYPMFSPYAYCANNPLKYIDPTGMIIDPASETEWNNEKQSITNKKTEIDNKISEISKKAIDKGWSEKKLDRKTSELKERSESLEKTLNTMNDLEDPNTPTIYKLQQVDQNGYFAQGKGENEGKLIIAYSSTSTFVHEVTHGGQYHNGEIGFNAKGYTTGYDLMDEVNAYRAAIAYKPWSYDNKYLYSSQITTDWVKYRTKANGDQPYKRLSPIPLNAREDPLMFKSDRRRSYNP
jgi:RHS repeat-associated protein